MEFFVNWYLTNLSTCVQILIADSYWLLSGGLEAIATSRWSHLSGCFWLFCLKISGGGGDWMVLCDFINAFWVGSAEPVGMYKNLPHTCSHPREFVMESKFSCVWWSCSNVPVGVFTYRQKCQYWHFHLYCVKTKKFHCQNVTPCGNRT